jgi:hypothetical protein
MSDEWGAWVTRKRGFCIGKPYALKKMSNKGRNIWCLVGSLILACVLPSMVWSQEIKTEISQASPVTQAPSRPPDDCASLLPGTPNDQWKQKCVELWVKQESTRCQKLEKEATKQLKDLLPLSPASLNLSEARWHISKRLVIPLGQPIGKMEAIILPKASLGDSQEFLRQLEEGAISQVFVQPHRNNLLENRRGSYAKMLNRIKVRQNWKKAINVVTCPKTLDAMILEESCVKCVITELRISPMK